MRTFSVKNDAINQKWVSKNLDSRDYEIKGDEIVITYFNESNHSYFADYKGGIVQIVCNETEEVVYEEEVR